MKATYYDSYNKKAVRENALSRYGLSKIIGLPGPDIVRCVRDYQQHGFTDITLYENNKKVLLIQLPEIHRVQGVKYNFEDIINAPIRRDTVYDLDFCCHLSTVEKYVRKFHENFILTVSERGIVRFGSVGLFLRCIGDKFIDRTIVNKDCIIVTSDRGKYLCTSYFDSSLMLTIHRI